MFYTLLEATAGAAGGEGATTGFGNWTMIISILLMVAVFYFLLIRPQKKQQKEQEAMMSALKPGDSIMTTSGFYGVILDIVDDTVIVEFGNNKNCRIPMNKAAIAQVDKPEAEAPAEEVEDKKEKKKMSLGKKKED
ncbi:MAG: preprotein translocase subunit YajC [Lachnospiraceae bacterium]|nr:preprotein translocase subunit YajC [Lachnospiraceae bacterium]